MVSIPFREKGCHFISPKTLLCFRVRVRVGFRVKVSVRVRAILFGQTCFRASVVDPTYLCFNCNKI